MNGINSKTGKSLSKIAHMRQSITDILTTPIGSRVMRRQYGSRLFELIDAPTNPVTVMNIYAAAAEALEKWEPRLKLNNIKINEISEQGKVSFTLRGIYLPDGIEITLDGIVL